MYLRVRNHFSAGFTHCSSHWSPPYRHCHCPPSPLQRLQRLSLSLSLGLHRWTSSDFLSFTWTSVRLVKISLWTSLFTYLFIESFLGQTHSLPLTPYCLGTSGITLLATFRLFIIFTTGAHCKGLTNGFQMKSMADCPTPRTRKFTRAIQKFADRWQRLGSASAGLPSRRPPQPP